MWHFLKYDDMNRVSITILSEFADTLKDMDYNKLSRLNSMKASL